MLKKSRKCVGPFQYDSYGVLLMSTFSPFRNAGLLPVILGPQLLLRWFTSASFLPLSVPVVRFLEFTTLSSSVSHESAPATRHYRDMSIASAAYAGFFF